MAKSSDLNRVSFIVMREMRGPIMALIVVYSISIVGMVFIPGPVVNGQTQYMSIFHAFYFMTYTATTTGFGEVPFEFSNAQRFWAIPCLYISVITWFYAIGSIISLLQNPFFVSAVAERRFSKDVQRIPGSFFIICGFGDTGSVLTRGLSDSGFPAVIIDNSPARIKALKLRDYKVPMPGLCADAGAPKHLLEAGIRNVNCKAIVAITNNEEVNLKISALARLLNPTIRIITMSKVEVFEDTLATLGGEVHIVDPFKTFAKVLASAMNHPLFYAFNKWLVREPGASLINYTSPPVGKWVVCGYGRMGHEVNRVLIKNGIKTSVIDPHEMSGREKLEDYIVGRTTSKTLVKAGIEDAVGILAGTDDDGHNLGILLNARTFNPNLFTLVRQNRHENDVAFEATQIDMIMEPTLVTSRRILFLLIAPLLKSFFHYLLQNKSGRREEMDAVIALLDKKVGKNMPHLVTMDISRTTSMAVVRSLDARRPVLLGHLLKHPENIERELDLVIFVAKRGEDITVLPHPDYELKEGDQLLYCGTSLACRMFYATLNNDYKLYYVQNGTFLPRGYFMQWLSKKTQVTGFHKPF